jgi:hypothetical protein
MTGRRLRAGRTVRCFPGDKGERIAAWNPEPSLVADAYHFPVELNCPRCIEAVNATFPLG